RSGRGRRADPNAGSDDCPRRHRHPRPRSRGAGTQDRGRDAAGRAALTCGARDARRAGGRRGAVREADAAPGSSRVLTPPGRRQPAWHPVTGRLPLRMHAALATAHYVARRDERGVLSPGATVEYVLARAADQLVVARAADQAVVAAAAAERVVAAATVDAVGAPA